MHLVSLKLSLNKLLKFTRKKINHTVERILTLFHPMTSFTCMVLTDADVHCDSTIR